MMNWIVNTPIAHRGLHNYSSVPENSLKAFECAVNKNHPIELDIHLLSDGNLAVFHDQKLDRMTGVRGSIFAQDASTVKKMRLFETDQHIPLIEEVFELINGKVPILIEIKNEKEVGILEQNLQNKLAHYSGEYAIQSFNPVSVCWFKKNAPHVIRGQLSRDFKSGNSAWYKKLLFRNLLMNWVSAPQFIGYNIKALPYAPVSIARNIFKVPILAWTIKNEQEKKKALTYADNFIFENIKL
jgi:glycerophosphoryl diester phosphodiesterase